MNLTRAKYARIKYSAQAAQCDALNRKLYTSSQFWFNAFYSILQLSAGGWLLKWPWKFTDPGPEFWYQPPSHPRHEAWPRHPSLFTKVANSGAKLFNHPPPPSLLLSRLHKAAISPLSSIQHQTFTIFTFLAADVKAAQEFEMWYTTKYFDTHIVSDLLLKFRNIAKSLQILISVNLDCANILIISKGIHEMLVWSRGPKRASRALCASGRSELRPRKPDNGLS